MTLPVYEVFALKYGHRVGTRGAIFVGGDPHDAPLAMDYFVWAIRDRERTVVVDVGYGREEGERRGRSFLRGPDEALALIDIDAAAVEDVVITHMHYDHAGNLELFPNARFHVQDTEMAFVTGRAMTHAALRHSFALPDVLEMVRLLYGDRVVFHAGDQDLLPGITLHHIPGHTPGMQSLRVHTARGWVVLASDAAHYYESLETGVPFATHESMLGMLEGFRWLRQLAPSERHVVPGHDPEVMVRYPAPSPELGGIVVRLDVEPNA